MAKKHRIGGKCAKGFAALSVKKRRKIAAMGGVACCTQRGNGYMAMIGQRGGLK